MATSTFNSIYHQHHSLRRRHSTDFTPTAATYSLFLRPTTTTSITAAPSLSLAAAYSKLTTNPSTSQKDISFDLLRQHLSSKNFREADEETRRLLICLAGEASVKRGYVFFSEVQFISEDDLKTIDELWKQHSDNEFGYSVQRKIWKKVNKDFTRFFIKVGWMKKLENSEVEQYNYRSFPSEFIWEEGAPEGHLPLTNALRGIQLLNSILNHPAFDGSDDCDEEGGNDGISAEDKDINSGIIPLSKRIFKPNYTF